MGKSLMDRIQAKLELFRLENRYTRRRHRRSTFISNAVYVDGEYVYQTPSTTGSSMESNGSHGTHASHGSNALHGERAAAMIPEVAELNEAGLTPSQQAAVDRAAEIERERERERKRMHRFSSISQVSGTFNGSSNPYSTNPAVIQNRRVSYIR